MIWTFELVISPSSEESFFRECTRPTFSNCPSSKDSSRGFELLVPEVNGRFQGMIGLIDLRSHLYSESYDGHGCQD
jgi:hypothetical protein